MKRAVLAFFLMFAVVFASLPVYAADFNAGLGKDEIPYGEFSGSNILYKYDSFDMMTEAEAKTAGVPDGYSGYVLKISAKESGVGIALDLSHIKVKEIEKITFRIYCPATTKSDGVRLTNDSKTSWIMLADPGKTGQWVEVVLDETSNFNTSEKSFDVFDDGNGYCKLVNFCFRFTGTNEIAYIDSIAVELKDPDTVPPVITYDGESVIETTAGRKLSLDARAYDEYYDSTIEPEYIYSDGAVDKNGLLLEGEHSCIVRFADPAGNSSELKLTLKVASKDVTAPVLSWAPDKIYANNGMRPVLDITASDDHDGDIEVTLAWSDGALDSRGRLCNGNHTLTITAVDETGNRTERVIPLIVTAGLPAKG